MKIEFDTETNELKVDGMIVLNSQSSLTKDANFLTMFDGDDKVLGYFVNLNIKFYESK